MTLLVIALFFGGLAAGLVDSIAGGGGLVTLPVLLALGLPEQLAIATNKGQAVFGATSSAVSFWRQGGIDTKRAPLAFVAGALGSLAGAALLLWMAPGPLKPLVVVLLVAAAVFVALPKRVRTSATPIPWPRLAVVAIAGSIGAYDGFFGPGTGTLLIVAFAGVFGDSLTRASGNAKVVNLASNLAAFTLFAIRGKIVWSFAVPMAVGNVCGAFIGSRLAMKGGDRVVRVAVLLVVTAIVAKLVWGLLQRA